MAKDTSNDNQSAIDTNALVEEIMQTGVLALQDITLVDEALSSLRNKNLSGQISYLYVVDNVGTLRGVVSFRKLLSAQPTQPLCDIMDSSIIALHNTDTFNKAIESFHKHRFLAFPVINAQNILVGQVDVTMVIESFDISAQHKELSSIFELIGLHLTIGKQEGIWAAFSHRVPWLLCNLGSGIFCAYVALQYDVVLEKSIAIAACLALVLALAESVSMQSMTLAIQRLSLQTQDSSRPLFSGLKEFVTAFLIGTACATLVGLTLYAWISDSKVVWVVSGTVFSSILLASLLGTVVPLITRKLKLNLKIAAGPISLALSDIATIAIYLFLAAEML